MVLKTALWAIPVADLGGVARHTLDVARAGVPGWRLVFLVPPGPLVDRLAETGATVLLSDFGPAHGLRSSYSSLRRGIETQRPDVVHTHLSYADIVGALVKPRQVPLVTTEHGIADDDLVYHGTRVKAEVMAAAHTARLRRADALIAVSEATLAVVRKKWHPGRRVRTVVIPNGVDPVPGAQRPRPGLRISALARLAPEKRLPELLDAFALVAADHPDALLTLAGVGDLERSLRDRANQLGVRGRVRFPGYVDAETLLGQTDVLAQLSVWENCSYSLLDAMVHGVGVVASPVGGNPELLPASALVDPADRDQVARLIVAQGTDLSRRPGLSPQWPTVGKMCARIADVYAGLPQGGAA